ncbi:MAG TPA: hypothetical protein VNT29_10700 [Candidatus Limnocylindrales bacterium]|nr:hypothetical protein [Candidatus Limnocylindrales bacterium]
MKPLQTLCVVLALIAVGVSAQTTRYTLSDGTSVDLPDLTITGSSLDCTVSYDATRGVFRYAYTLSAPATNRVPVQAFKIDVSGTTTRPQTDLVLAENIVRAPAIQPATTIPVGITIPDPGHWRAGLSRSGMVFASARKSLMAVAPGASAGGFVLESRLTPGVRKAEISPSRQPWLDIMNAMPETGAEFVEPHPDEQKFAITTTTIAPIDIADSALYNGGGQQPAEVNKFLRYAAPLDNRNKVSANSTYTVIVYYGTTINTATFAATLDGADITSRFHPVPGGADVVKIAIGTSTTKLHLSVDGTKSSGGKGTDSDTLTFLPQ